MVQKVIKISDLQLLSKVINYGKAIIASNKQNYQIDLNQIKGKIIKFVSEDEASHADGERRNIIKLTYDTGETKYFSIYNGTDGDKGKIGNKGPQGDKGNDADMNALRRYTNEEPLRIVNDDITNNANAVWSAYRGKVLNDFLRSISEIFMTDEEYQLLFNDELDEEGRPNDIHQVYIDMDFTTTEDNESSILIYRDTKSYKTYVKYWTYEDSSAERYFIKNSSGEYEEVSGKFDIWRDFYTNTNNEIQYYTRRLVSEYDPITGEVTHSEYVYTEIFAPIWLDLEFTTTLEDEICTLLYNDICDDDEDQTINKEQKEDEIVIVHRPITSISIDGSGSSVDNPLIIPINTILVKAINIQPIDYLNSPISIDYDENKIKVFEDGRIMALSNNCETTIKIYSEEDPSKYANIYLKVITYVEKIEFNMQTIKGFKGSTQKIITTVLPKTASNKSIKWTSSNDEIADIDKDGIITLKSEGQVTIYAESLDGSNIISRIDIMVDTAVSRIEVEDTYEILVGKSTTITPKIYPENATDKTLIWESSNNNILAVPSEPSETGQLYLTSKDNVTVTLTAHDGYVDSNNNIVSKTFEIIGKTPVRTIELNYNSVTIDKDEEIQLIAYVNDDADNKKVIWSSSNDLIATVDETGKVKGISGGEVTIICESADGFGTRATCNVTSVVLITNITIDQDIHIFIGNTYNINYNIEPINANIRTLEWYTSNNDIAEVTSSGYITGKKEGNIKVYAMATDNSGIIASANVTVTIPTSELLLSTYELNMNVDDVYTLIATVQPDNTTNQNLIYEVLDPTIVNIDNNGNITALKEGSTSIFVKTTDGTTNNDNTPLSAKCEINVQ